MGEGFRFRPPESEKPKPVVPAVEKGPEPEVKLSPEKAKPAPHSDQKTEIEAYDRSYWTPERISANVASFFEKLERNEQRMRAESRRLLEQAVREKEAREIARKAIAEKEMAETEEQRRAGLKKELEETEAQREFRYTIEWMIEQSHDQVQDLAINFLQGTGAQNQTQDEDK
jgi:Glu-tRNA(Gln) amidotransferase subunit E-like FAD-binding protein